MYVEGALKVGSNISAVVTQSRDDEGTTATGDYAGRRRLLINGKPVYQLVAEASTTAVGGIAGNLFSLVVIR